MTERFCVLAGKETILVSLFIGDFVGQVSNVGLNVPHVELS